MTDRPVFDQANIVVSDMDAAVRFYRLLGLEIRLAPGDWPPGSGACHADALPGGGARLDVDNVAMARIWGDRGLKPGNPVIGFSLASRDAVDATYAQLMGAGYVGRVEPYDAFFGARYAIVEDPDGHCIGLMSPIDPEHRHTPGSDND